MNSLFKCVGCFIVVLGLFACGSSGPATTYYGLFPNDDFKARGNAKMIQSLGVGPIDLPEYLDTTALVSKSDTNVINVSGYHAWAEPLDASIARVVAANMGALLDLDVWAFPWDARHRPNNQIKIIIESLEGVRGANVSMKAKWFVYSLDHKTILKQSNFTATQRLNSKKYAAYVAAIQKNIDELSAHIASELQ